MAVIQSPTFADQACSIALKTIQVTQPRHLLRESGFAARALRSSRAVIGGVKKLLTRLFAREDWSTPGPADQGWSAVEDTLKLSGWTQARHVIVLRRAVKSDLALSRKAKANAKDNASNLLPQWGEQIELLMPDQDVQA